MKEDLKRVFHDFHTQVIFLCTTFIEIVPKKAGAIGIKEFVPVSLVDGVHKTIAKVIVNRLITLIGEWHSHGFFYSSHVLQ